MWPNSQEIPDLVKFTVETRRGKLFVECDHPSGHGVTIEISYAINDVLLYQVALYTIFNYWVG